MKNLVKFLCLTLVATLWAEEASDIPQEAFVVSGGLVELDESAWDPELLAFINESADMGEVGEEDSSIEVMWIYRQIVAGVKYITYVQLDGEPAIFIIHKDLYGAFSLLESHKKSAEIVRFLTQNSCDICIIALRVLDL